MNELRKKELARVSFAKKLKRFCVANIILVALMIIDYHFKLGFLQPIEFVLFLGLTGVLLITGGALWLEELFGGRETQ